MTAENLARAMEWACPVCASQPGEQCRNGPVPAWVYREQVHAERLELGLANAPGVAVDAPSEAQMRKAIEDVGLLG